MDSRCVNMECLLSLVCSILATAPSYSRMLFPAPQENCLCLRVLHRIQILFQFWGKVRESFPGGSVVQNSPANVGDSGSIPGSPGEGSGNPPWKITQTEEPGGLQSVGSQRSWTQLSNSATTATKRRPLVTTAEWPAPKSGTLLTPSTTINTPSPVAPSLSQLTPNPGEEDVTDRPTPPSHAGARTHTPKPEHPSAGCTCAHIKSGLFLCLIKEAEKNSAPSDDQSGCGWRVWQFP